MRGLIKEINHHELELAETSVLTLLPILLSVPFKSLFIFDLCRIIRRAEMNIENNVRGSPWPKGSLPNTIKHVTNAIELRIDPKDM